MGNKGNLILGIFLPFVCIGCSSIAQPNTVSNLQIKMAHMEKRVQKNEEDIVRLRTEMDSVSQYPTTSKYQNNSYGIDAVVSEDATYEPSVVKGDSEIDRIVRVDIDIKTLQKALTSSGFYSGSIDGKLGAKTKSAIYEFQKEHDLKADGVVGKQTWAELKNYLQ